MYVHAWMIVLHWRLYNDILCSKLIYLNLIELNSIEFDWI